jgi:hypothetical protein
MNTTELSPYGKVSNLYDEMSPKAKRLLASYLIGRFCFDFDEDDVKQLERIKEDYKDD